MPYAKGVLPDQQEQKYTRERERDIQRATKCEYLRLTCRHMAVRPLASQLCWLRYGMCSCTDGLAPVGDDIPCLLKQERAHITQTVCHLRRRGTISQADARQIASRNTRSHQQVYMDGLDPERRDDWLERLKIRHAPDIEADEAAQKAVHADQADQAELLGEQVDLESLPDSDGSPSQLPRLARLGPV